MIFESVKRLSKMAALAAVSNVTAKMQREVERQLPPADGEFTQEDAMEVQRLKSFRQALGRIQITCRSRFLQESQALQTALEEK